MPRVLLVSAYQGLSARVPEVLAGHDLSITVLGAPRGQLLTSSYVDTYQVVTAGRTDFSAALAAEPCLFDREAHFVFFDDDQLLRDLADSDLPTDVKRRCLAASTDFGLAALGSKVGQQLLAEAAGVRTPRTQVVRRRDELPSALRSVGAPALVKGDLGGGGAFVRTLDDLHEAQRIRGLDAWLPLLIQEHIAGALISIEPLFKRGQLLGYLYSQMLRTTGGPNGPSTVRLFLDPPAPEVTEMLAALGSTGGLHGFANVTMIREQSTGMHYLIECDMRINTWVQFGPRLGMDWGSLITGDMTGAPRTTSLGPQGRTIHLYPRELESVLADRRWASLRPWLLREPGTWDTRNAKDAAVEDAELRSLLSASAVARGLFMRPAQRLWNAIPPGPQSALESRGWKTRGLRCFGIQA